MFPITFKNTQHTVLTVHGPADIPDLEGGNLLNKQGYRTIDRGTGSANTACTWIAVGY